MPNRKDYFQEYNRKNREKRLRYFKEKYKADKKERLTYAQTYYILNKDKILIMAKLRDTTKSGHAHAIWKATAKYAKKWNIPFISWPEFKTWSMTDEGYESIYNQWKESDFDRTYGPVIMRGVKKGGFVPENLKWDYREQYSWWSTEMETFKKVEKNLDDQQHERNKRDKEWRKKVREEWKAKKEKQMKICKRCKAPKTYHHEYGDHKFELDNLDYLERKFNCNEERKARAKRNYCMMCRLVKKSPFGLCKECCEMIIKINCTQEVIK